MFTGIITHVTPVKKSHADDAGLTVTFLKPKDWDDLVLGESIATNGICLTVTAIDDDAYECYLIAETLDKTSFGVKIPAEVNVERAMRSDARFGGHFVQGHVDGVGRVARLDMSRGCDVFIDFPAADQALVVYKGSISINGVSLTVASVEHNTLHVSLVPYTLDHTTLGTLRVGDIVNLEFDVIGKYIQKAIEGVPDYAARRTSQT